MAEVGNREAPKTRRLVLGFDAGCMSCSDLARRIEERVGDKLEVRSLRDPQVEEWRRRALGEDAPWTPTLIEVKGLQVRAWTGRKMGMHLGRALGPLATWRVLQVLGEVGAVGEVAGSPVGTMVGISRGQFLKGVAGAAVAASIVPSANALFASEEAHASAKCRDSKPTESTGTTERQNRARRIVEGSKQYSSLLTEQKRLGGKFEWQKAVIKADPCTGDVASVQVASNTKSRNLFTVWIVNLRTGKLMLHNGTSYTGTKYKGDKNLFVRPLVKTENSEKFPYSRGVIIGKDYVVANGKKMSWDRFKKELKRLKSQRKNSEQGAATQASTAQTTQYTPLEQCLLDASAQNQAFSNFTKGCGAVGLSINAGGLFAGPFIPAVEAVGFGVDFGCVAIDFVASPPSPAEQCANA